MIDCFDCGHSAEWHPRGPCLRVGCGCRHFEITRVLRFERIESLPLPMIETTAVDLGDEPLEIDDYPAIDSIIEEA